MAHRVGAKVASEVAKGVAQPEKATIAKTLFNIACKVASAFFSAKEESSSEGFAIGASHQSTGQEREVLQISNVSIGRYTDGE